MADNQNRVKMISSDRKQIEETILKGKKSFLQGNSAKSLVRFELEEGTKRSVVIAEDVIWRRCRVSTGNPIGHFKVVTHYVMDTSCEPRRWIDLDSNLIDKHSSPN